MNPTDPPPFQATEPPPLPPQAVAPAAPPRPAYEAALEQVARAMLKERRSEQRWRVFFRLAWLGLVLAVAWALFVARNHVNTATGPHTALIDVRGEIAAESEASAEGLVAALKTAFEDKGTQAVVLRINSPGGSPVQAGIINDEIRRLKAKHKKKVYAVVEEICASGAYYIAVAADEIYVDKASLVGSIGVLMDGFGFTGTMEKLGVERRLMTAGENKAFMDPFSPVNQAHQAFTKSLLADIHGQFIDVVKKGRGKRLKDSPEIFSGLMWTGAKGIELGLADGYGTVDSVARDVFKAETIVDYTEKENIADRLAKRFGAQVGSVIADRVAPRVGTLR